MFVRHTLVRRFTRSSPTASGLARAFLQLGMSENSMQRVRASWNGVSLKVGVFGAALAGSLGLAPPQCTAAADVTSTPTTSPRKRNRGWREIPIGPSYGRTKLLVAHGGTARVPTQAPRLRPLTRDPRASGGCPHTREPSTDTPSGIPEASSGIPEASSGIPEGPEWDPGHSERDPTPRPDVASRRRTMTAARWQRRRHPARVSPSCPGGPRLLA